MVVGGVAAGGVPGAARPSVVQGEPGQRAAVDGAVVAGLVDAREAVVAGLVDVPVAVVAGPQAWEPSGGDAGVAEAGVEPRAEQAWVEPRDELAGVEPPDEQAVGYPASAGGAVVLFGPVAGPEGRAEKDRYGPFAAASAPPATPVV